MRAMPRANKEESKQEAVARIKNDEYNSDIDDTLLPVVR